MKRLLLLFFVLPMLSHAQRDSIRVHSPLVKMLLQPNSFTALSYDSIGTSSDIMLCLATAYSLKDNSRQRSVCFTNRGFFSTDNKMPENILQIPIEELSNFVTALELIENEIETPNRINKQRFHYISSNNTVLSAERRYYNTRRWDILLYAQYQHVFDKVPGTSIIITQRNIGPLLSLLKKLQQKLGDNLYLEL